MSPLPLGLTGAALLAPAVMAPSGADHRLRVLSQRHLGGSPDAEPVSLVVPYALPLALVAVDLAALPADECEVARPMSAMLQAVTLTLGAATSLKWIAGRSWPNAGADPHAPDRLQHPHNARRFAWLEGWNADGAWPSGHTALMMSAAAALASSTPEYPWLGYLGYASATAVAAGMWLGDHHWASDIVSGGLLGFAIGRSVGRAFASREPEPTWALVPWIGHERYGASLSWGW
jgi:membrane-associated phospholipid phosphatase